jgi:lysophospholipase L1-like esterase
MIDRARAAEVKTILLVTPNPIVAHYVEKRHPKHPQESFAPWLAKYDQIVRDLASTNQLPLVDLGKRVLELQPELEGKDSLIRNLANSKSADGVHLTAAGYKIMAELVADTLGDAVQPGQRVVCFGDSITFGAHMKGAGTATGETYPAWLWLTLNRKLGQTDATEPPSAAK